MYMLLEYSIDTYYGVKSLRFSFRLSFFYSIRKIFLVNVKIWFLFLWKRNRERCEWNEIRKILIYKLTSLLQHRETQVSCDLMHFQVSHTNTSLPVHTFPFSSPRGHWPESFCGRRRKTPVLPPPKVGFSQIPFRVSRITLVDYVITEWSLRFLK